MNIISIITAVKILIAVSLTFVWIVRYENIKLEFKEYGMPDWLRDFVGILKLSSAAMLLNSDRDVCSFGIALLIFLMVCALLTHLVKKTKLSKRIPALVLLTLSIALMVAS